MSVGGAIPGGSVLTDQLAQIPGAAEVRPGIWLLPAVKSRRLLAAGALLIAAEVPLLIDAGMDPAAARALRESNIAGRLHLTHMHLDHRMHQQWFVAPRTTCPAVEREAFTDWDRWLAMSGFPADWGPGFHAWRAAHFHVETVPHIRGVEHGDDLNPGGLRTEVLALPGHTSGHSGLWFPELKTALVTDYDMETFGPWYGNPTSDLDAYVSTLEGLLARTDIEWFITSHTRGMLDAEAFQREGRRYLELIEGRSRRIADLLRSEGPMTVEGLVGRRVFYPPSALKRQPLFEFFERRMTVLHLERMADRGAVRRNADGLWRVA